jgi:hypothetical protein
LADYNEGHEREMKSLKMKNLSSVDCSEFHVKETKN